MRIGLTYNTIPETSGRDVTDQYAEFDSMETISTIKKALESGNHEVVLIEADRHAFEKLKSSSLDFVFNVAEGFSGDSRESHIPAMLEMLNIPYTGSKVLTLGITLNKAMTKEVLAYNRIPTPKFQIFKSPNDSLKAGMEFPLFVKPNFEGSSKGITARSLVRNEGELRETLKFIFGNYHQTALVEEYLDGREFTVSLLGNPPKVLPIVEVIFDHLPEEIPKFECYEVKWFWDDPNKGLDPLVCPAKIDKKLEEKIKRISIDTFNALGCLDLCRIDIRIDKKGNPAILEVNALPGLIPNPNDNSRFPRSCYTSGMSYNDMILGILNAAKNRVENNGILK